MISLASINQNNSIAQNNPANLKDFCGTDCGILTPYGVMRSFDVFFELRLNKRLS